MAKINYFPTEFLIYPYRRRGEHQGHRYFEAFVSRFVEDYQAVLRRLLTDTDTIAEVMAIDPSFPSGSGSVGSVDSSGVEGVVESINV